MHSGGKTTLLEAGNYKAKIVSVGAGLAELTYKNRHLVIPHDPEVMPSAHMGKVLIPWPNRVANGCYNFENEEYKLPINEHMTNAAIHGFLAWRDWHITKQSTSSVSLTLELPPSYGYPFLLLSTVTYILDDINGLSMYITSKNIGKTNAPYGVATHPYLTCNLESIENCILNIPAQRVFAVDEKMNPTYLQPVKKLNLDFTNPKIIKKTFIDNTFAAELNQWKIEIKSIETGFVTYIHSDQPWIQVYTGDKLNRIGLAIEPMSCPPNAFNSKISLITLQPSEEYTMSLTIGGY